MKNKLYVLLAITAIGFTSCQKTPYATFQKSQSETFARSVKAKPVFSEAVKAAELPGVINQIPASTITASVSNDISLVEPTNLLSPTKTASVEEVVVPATVTSKVSTPVIDITNISGKNKLLSKIVAKKINKLSKKAEKANSSTLRGSNDLLYVGLVVLAIGLLLTLVPVANVLAGIVIAAGAVIAIIGLLQRII